MTWRRGTCSKTARQPRPDRSSVSPRTSFAEGVYALSYLDTACYGQHNYPDLPEELQIAHDIREGLKAVYAPAKLQVRTVMTKHGQAPQEAVPPEDLHQAFRYGIPIEAEADVAADLQRVMEWLKERLG